VVSFTARPLYSRVKSHRYPLDRRLGGPQSQSGRLGEEKILDPSGTRNSDPSVVQSVASRYTDYPIPAHKTLQYIFKNLLGTLQRSWLRHCATNWKVAVSSPNKVDFFNLSNSSSRTMALWSTEALNRNEYQESSCGVKSGRRVRLTTLPLSVSLPSIGNVGASTSHNPMGLNGLLPVYLLNIVQCRYV
jgi:hypothetical protein